MKSRQKRERDEAREKKKERERKRERETEQDHNMSVQELSHPACVLTQMENDVLLTFILD